MVDGVAPTVVSTSLPSEGASTQALLNQFTINFSKTMAPAAVTNSANYTLQDNHGNTYVLVPDSYGNGLSETIAISNGGTNPAFGAPLQPGNYTLSLGSGITDRARNPLTSFQLHFTVSAVSPFVTETANNNSPATATPLVPPTNQPDGSFTVGNSYTVGSNPYFTASARLRGVNAPLDLVTANEGTNTISVLLGNGDGTFQTPVNYTVGSNPIALAIGDLNGDGKPDLAVANYGSSTVSVLLGNGDGTFQNAVTYNVQSNPRGVAIANLDGKNGNDLVVANWSSRSVSVLLNQGNGTFQSAVNYTVGNNPGNVTVADLNGDGKLDVITPNNSDDTVSVLPGNGDGTFGTAITLSTGSSTNPINVVATDLNGDGKLDLATANNGNGTVSVLLNQGTAGAALQASTFAAAVSYGSGGNSPYHLVATDLNGDGKMDLAVADYGSSRVGVLLGNGDGTLQPVSSYSVSGNPIGITAGDFNGDGLTDLATANYGNSTVSVLLSNAAKPLPVDPTTGLMSGYGRGNLSSTSDIDYFSFTGKAGDVVYLASESPGNPSASGLYYELDNSTGSSLGSFYANYNNQGQSGPITLPTSGTYYVHVSYDYGYTGEYRFRVTEASPPVQLPTVYDGSVSSANTPVLANTSPGHLTATVAGYVGQGDPNGEYFNLGNVVAGTTLNLSESQPANSGLGSVLNIYNAAGTNLTNNTTASTSLSYTVPTGQAGTYYARVSASSGTSGLLSQYVLSLDVANTTPPQVTATTLPAQGTTSAAVIDRFTLNFSEDMNAASVNNTANYTLKDSQGNVYHLSSPNYSSGSSATYLISDGPLQPGTYTLSVSANLTDRTGNPLVPYSQSFSVVGVPPYTLENRGDNSLATATPLVPPTNQPDGSFTVGNSYTVGSNPYFTASARLRGVNAPLDLVTANEGTNTISVLLGNGDGTFQTPVNYTVGSNPIALAIGDLNGDGKPDLAVANYGSSTVSVLLGNGDGTFQNAVTYNVQSNPRGVAIANLDGKNGNDLVVANWSSRSVSVLLNQGNGTFQSAVNYTVGNNPGNVTVADLNGDGKLDVITPNNSDDTVSVLPGNGDGTFGTAITLSTGSSTNPIDVVATDLNGDGKLDLATANNGNGTVSVLLNQGTAGAALQASTFAAAVSYGSGGNSPYHLVATDLNGDGKMDLAVADYGSSRVGVLLGNGDGTLQPVSSYSVSGNPIGITAGDFNGDGLTDLATANYGNSTVSVLLSNAAKPLPVDPTTGLMSGYGRGNLSSTSDIDYFSFTGKAGDVVYLASESPGNPSASGLYYELDNSTGSSLGSFYANYNNQGQSGPITLPTSGTYYVHVSYDYGYTGEYRFRVTEASPPVQLPTVYDGSVSSANTPVLANTSPGHLTATVAGYVGQGDPNGEYFNLGNVVAGTTLNLSESQPANSGLGSVLNIYNAAGTNLTNNTTASTSLSYTVPTGQAGTYYARVSASSGTSGLLSQYVLSLDVANTTPPQVTATTLPAQGTTSAAVIDRFTLNFSEDMNAASVNNTANYTLKDSQGNVYHLSSPNYSSGSSATYLISDGPLQPGTYTLSVSANLTDRTGNPLVPYSQSFSVVGVPPYTLENRGDNSLATATPLVPPTNQPDGSFTVGNSYTVGSNPYFTASARLRGVNAPLDLVTANEGTNTISVLLGNGDGTFQTPVNYTVGSNPIALAIGDLNGDGKPDLAVANYGSSTVSVLLGNGDGTFQNAVTYNVQSNPRGVAIANLDGKNGNDLVVANWSSRSVSVLLNQGNGTFQSAVNYTVGNNPGNVTVADLNGDGKLDVITPNNSDDTVSVLPGNGDGTFGTAITLSTGSSTNPIDVVATDLNGDGKLDLATANNGNGTVSVLLNQGTAGAALQASTFAAAVSYGSGGNSPYHLVATDLNGDGKMDLAVADYGSSRVGVLLGNGDGTLQPVSSYSVSGNPIGITAGDFNGDGLTDLATANYGNSTVSVLLSNAAKPLPVDPTTGLMSGYGRGNLSSTSDIDYFSFTGKAGDVVYLASESPGNPSASGLYYELDNSTGSSLGSFYANYNNQGQSGPITLPTSGTYYVHVSYDYGYTGEYRFRVTEASPPVQLPTVYDGSVSSANTPVLANTSPGHLTATVAGYVGQGDPNGEYFNLGNVVAGTTLNLSESQPANSGLGSVLNIYNAAGTNLTNNTTASTSLSYTVPTGQAGTYYARVSASSGTSGLLSQYVLSLDVANTTPPQVTATTLPAQGTTSTGILNAFTVNFSSDLQAASVNNTAHYDLRGAGPDGVFGTSDDLIYHLSNPGYSSGTSAAFQVTDGPLQPDNYQLTISGLSDRFGNVMAAPFVLTFTVANLPNYTFQGRSAHTAATATPLTVTADPAGSGLSLAAGRGELINGNDIDYWSFSGTAGDLLSLVTQKPNNPSASGLYYVITNPDGTTLTTIYDSYYGQIVSAPIALPATGTYTVAVHPYYGYYNEYDFRVLLAAPSLQEDTEPSNTLATAANLTLTANGNSKVANVAGTILAAGDLNYYNLGTIQAGQSILLNTQLPTSSGLTPVVSVYNSLGVYQPKTNGRPFDGVGQIDITTTGTYYALVQGGNSTNGLFDQYVLNVQVLPTSSLAQLPNLEVTSISLPTASNIQSGQPVTFSWTVTNAGQAPTNVSSWSDRVVLSLDSTYGNSDDIQLGVFRHTGVLNPGDSYTSTQTVNLPDGISGNYYLIVQTDSNQEVNENAIGRGDGTTVSSGGPNNNGTFTVNLAPYPDLVVGGLQVSGPNNNGTFTVSWNTVNNGNGAVANNWKEHLVVQNQTTGDKVVDTVLSFSGGLAAGGSVAHTLPISGSYAVDGPGHFQVTVTTNSDQSLYEDNAQGHAAAVQNDISSTTFDATRDLQVVGLSLTSPASPQSGNQVTIGWNDTNTGNLATSGSWNDSVTVVNTTTGATLVNAATVPYNGGSIQPGGQAARSYSFTLSDGDAGVGSVKVIVTVNANSALAEYNTAGTASSNNTSTPLIFTSTLAPYPDLVVKSGSLGVTPSSPQSGNQMTVTWNDQNQGNAAVNASFSDYVLVQRVNADNSLTTVASGTVAGNSTLAAGATSAPAGLPIQPARRGFRCRQLPGDGDDGLLPVGQGVRQQR